jgi:hypothetical protein
MAIRDGSVVIGAREARLHVRGAPIGEFVPDVTVRVRRPPGPPLDAGHRFALCIANYTYDDFRLQRLVGAPPDVARLVATLRTPTLRCFTTPPAIRNRPVPVLTEKIDELFSGRASEDVVLLYLAGVFIQDSWGGLTFATKATDLKSPAPTSLDAAFLRDRMRQCRSRRKLLILDCAYAAPAPGRRGRIEVAEHFGGSGGVVITSSPELNRFFAASSASRWLLTEELITALRHPGTDADQDGSVTAQELFEAVCARVERRAGGRRPEVLDAGVGRRLIVARSRAQVSARVRVRHEPAPEESAGSTAPQQPAPPPEIPPPPPSAPPPSAPPAPPPAPPPPPTPPASPGGWSSAGATTSHLAVSIGAKVPLGLGPIVLGVTAVTAVIACVAGLVIVTSGGDGAPGAGGGAGAVPPALDLARCETWVSDNELKRLVPGATEVHPRTAIQLDGTGAICTWSALRNVRSEEPWFDWEISVSATIGLGQVTEAAEASLQDRCTTAMLPQDGRRGCVRQQGAVVTIVYVGSDRYLDLSVATSTTGNALDYPASQLRQAAERVAVQILDRLDPRPR